MVRTTSPALYALLGTVLLVGVACSSIADAGQLAQDDPAATTTTTTAAGSDVEPTPDHCDPSYPSICVPPPPPKLTCDEVGYVGFKVTGDDPHGFDQNGDGRGCGNEAPSTPTPEPTPTPPPTPTLGPPTPTPGPKTSFGDGTYRVGVDIQPGTYRNSNASGGCYWERLSGFSGELDDVITNNFAESQQIVTILPSDAGFSSDDCGTWGKIG